MATYTCYFYMFFVYIIESMKNKFLKQYLIKPRPLTTRLVFKVSKNTNRFNQEISDTI